MAVDYDLVILSGSSIGRYAAARAIQWNARVALIEPPRKSQPSELTTRLHHQVLRQSGQLLQQMRRSPHWGMQWEQSPHPELRLHWQEARDWAEAAAEVLEDHPAEGRSLELLAAAGVDVVLGQGEFCRRPHWGVSVNGRLLRSRSFLLAPQVQPQIPTIAGFAHIPYFTLDNLWQHPPDRLIILGSDPRGVELAQALNRLGTQVTLIARAVLLPHEDREAANLIQTQLETEGVTVLTQAIVTQAESAGTKILLKVNDRLLEADGLLLATAPQLNLSAFNLEAVGVKWQPHRIAVSPKLQTSHPRIYACGEALGGYSGLALGHYEAAIAVRNALFLPTSSVNYAQVPLALFTEPPLARIGLSEIQARQTFGKEVMTLKQFTKTLAIAQIESDTTGFCKLIVHRNGEILGAHWVGTGASEGIATIALAMQQRHKVSTIAQLPFISLTHTELLQAIAQQYVQQQQHTRHRCLEAWFTFRRDWTS